MNKNIPRREFLSKAAVTAAALGEVMLPSAVSSAEKTNATGIASKPGVTAQEYLKGLLYTREEVQQWLDGKAFPFAK